MYEYWFSSKVRVRMSSTFHHSPPSLPLTLMPIVNEKWKMNENKINWIRKCQVIWSFCTRFIIIDELFVFSIVRRIGISYAYWHLEFKWPDLMPNSINYCTHYEAMKCLFVCWQPRWWTLASQDIDHKPMWFIPKPTQCTMNN